MVPNKVLKLHWLKEPKYTPTLIRGRTFLEAGYIYAPYIPMISEPTSVDNGFTPSRSLESRYATKVVNNSYYGVIDSYPYGTQ